MFRKLELSRRLELWSLYSIGSDSGRLITRFIVSLHARQPRVQKPKTDKD